MKIINEQSRKLTRNNVSTYDFDKIDSLNDIIKIIKIIEESGVIIKGIKVSEFGDYDDGNKVIIYKDIETFKKVSSDFAGCMIDSYGIVGQIENLDIFAEIYPDINRLKIYYLPDIKEKIETIKNSFSR